MPELFSGVRLPAQGCLGLAENTHDLEMRYNAQEREQTLLGQPTPRILLTACGPWNKDLGTKGQKLPNARD